MYWYGIESDCIIHDFNASTKACLQGIWKADLVSHWNKNPRGWGSLAHKCATLPHPPTSKIHWASKETYHFFRAALTKIQSMKINHIWTQFSYNSTPYQAHLKKQKKVVWLSQNGVKSQEVTFQKSQKLLVSRPRSSARTKASTVVT